MKILIAYTMIILITGHAIASFAFSTIPDLNVNFVEIFFFKTVYLSLISFFLWPIVIPCLAIFATPVIFNIPGHLAPFLWGLVGAFIVILIGWLLFNLWLNLYRRTKLNK